MVLQLSFVTDSFALKFRDLAKATPFIYALENKSEIVVVVSLLTDTMK